MEFPSGPAGGGLKYSASKILAHQASQQFIREHNPHFTMITIHPTFVLGPSLVQKSADNPNGTIRMFMRSLESKQPTVPTTCVDVRDVADAILATVDAKVERNGEEFIISGVKLTWDDVVAYVKSAYPQFPMQLQPPYEEPFVANSAKAERMLGMKWRPIEDLFGGFLDQQLELREQSKM
jgi:nucleoside-diphosphate-sugar epimerase